MQRVRNVSTPLREQAEASCRENVLVNDHHRLLFDLTKKRDPYCVTKKGEDDLLSIDRQRLNRYRLGTISHPHQTSARQPDR